MIDMTSYKTASRLSPQINAGASARLNLQPMVSDLSGEAHAAFCYGWRSTDDAENRAGRTIPGRGFTIHQDGEMQVWMVDPPAATSMEGLLQPIIDRALSLIDSPSAVVRVSR